MNAPTALVEPKRKQRPLILLVPAIVLVAVIWFLVDNLRGQGIPVEIRFQAGQGIGVGDSVRYLGIDIGKVEDVTLAPEGDGVVVRAELEPFARDLARKGTRFWVVRPRISLDGLAGLDTLVGARYIDTLPGPRGTDFAESFRGLEEPPIQVPEGALELTLIASHVGGLSTGAPVLWKRIEVGRVLSVGLSSDARTIQARVAIDPQYSALVLETSRFYRNTGLDLEVGIGGMQLEVDSLRSLLIGGVAFATPEEPAAPARTGQRFELADKAKEEWLEWHPALLIQQDSDAPSLARPLPSRAKLSYDGGLFSRTKTLGGWTLWTDRGLLGPAEVLELPAEGAEESTLEVSGRAFEPPVGADEEPSGLALLTGLRTPPLIGLAWPADRCRSMAEPEDCLIFGDPNVTAIAVDASAIDPESGEIRETAQLTKDWQGAAVISRTDGQLVGLVLVGSNGARIAPLPPALLE